MTASSDPPVEIPLDGGPMWDYLASLDRATRQGIEMVLRAMDYDEAGEGR